MTKLVINLKYVIAVNLP